MALTRLREAEVLLAARQYSGAYYLAGYAVECALKACIAKKVKRYDFPDRRLALDAYTHDLKRLVEVAEIGVDIAGQRASDAVFDVKWKTVVRWSEQSRYEKCGRRQAETLIHAIADDQHGVLPWLQLHW